MLFKAVFLTVFMLFQSIMSQVSQPGQSITDGKNEIIATGANNEPRLLSGGAIAFPTVLLKKGVFGTISAQADIDSKGKVERCTIKEGLDPLLDSIVCKSIIASVYSPAYEMGQAIPSTIVLQMDFDPDSVIKENNSVPQLEGVVLDKDSKAPLRGAVVNMQYQDSLSDPELSIGFNRYIELIGHHSGQKYSRGILSTITDSSGHFSFRLLPDGIVEISVLAEHYTLTQFRENVQTGYRKEVRYFLEPHKVYTDTSLNITVYGKNAMQSEVVDIEKQQQASGMTHYLSKILLTKATIRQVPEGASAMLVRSGTPYDNRYLIAGVPFLSPYHFGGYPYADMDGLMLSTLNKVNVTIDRIAGRFPDVSGALIEANPGVYRPANTKIKRKPELAIDFSTMGQDFLLSVANKKDDFLQLGFTRGESFSLTYLDKGSGFLDTAGISIGKPTAFGNVTATARLTTKNVQSELFSWFAYDYYLPKKGSDEVFIPWGMTSIRFHPTDKENYAIVAGGAHQYSVDGIRVAKNSFLKEVYITNGVLSFKLDSLSNKYFQIVFNSDLSYQEYDGTLKQRDRSGIDTAIKVSGKEISGNLNSTICKQAGPLQLNTNILLSGVLYENDPDVIIDGGISLAWKNDNFETELNLGRITTRPDIRGLPDSQYRKETYHTYLLSIPVSYRSNDLIKIGLQPYMRYDDRAPQMDPLYGIWEKSRASQVTSRGADCDLTIQPTNWIEVNGAVNIVQAHRGENQDSVYEWNDPLTLRGRVHLSFLNKMIHLYINGIRSEGLSYYDFKEKKYLSLPDYKRLDLDLQYRSKALDHSFFTRYDAYILANNVLGNYNVRGYYWNSELKKYSLYLSGPMSLEVGVKLGFRL